MKVLFKIFYVLVFASLFLVPLFSQNEDIEDQKGQIKETEQEESKRPLNAFEKKIAKQRFMRDMSAIYDYVYENYYVEPDTEEILVGAITGLMRNLGDPYSTYITPDKVKEYDENISGKFGGLGVRIDLGTDKDTGITYVKVVAPIKNTPAALIGIRTGDLIISVDGKNLGDMTLRDAVKLLRGEPGTKAKLTIKRGKKIIPIIITRAIINNINMEFKFIDDDIVYISIDSFSRDLPDDFEEALTEINERSYNTIIVDLRGNPGGDLNAVTNLADAFLKKSVIVGAKQRNKSVSNKYYATNNVLIDPNVKVVVIVDSGSASASEIFAGAIQDNKRGTVVGETTYGKGLIQSVTGFESGLVSLSISQYHTPSGRFINKKGIEPDVVIDGEEDLSVQDQHNMQIIIGNEIARKFVEKNKGKSVDQLLPLFEETLRSKALSLSSKNSLRRLLHSTRNSVMNSPEVFNLEIDTVLQRTVAMIKSGEI